MVTAMVRCVRLFERLRRKRFVPLGSRGISVARKPLSRVKTVCSEPVQSHFTSTTSPSVTVWRSISKIILCLSIYPVESKTVPHEAAQGVSWLPTMRCM